MEAHSSIENAPPDYTEMLGGGFSRYREILGPDGAQQEEAPETKPCLRSQFCRMGGGGWQPDFPLWDSAHPNPNLWNKLLPIRPGTRAHAFSHFGYIFNQADAHDVIERRKHTRSLVSLLGNLPFIILTNTGQGQESRSKKNEINQQNNWETGIDVTQCSLGFVYTLPILKNSIRGTFDCLLV